MSSTWDHRADKDLLLAIIDDGQLKSIKWPGIVLKMQEKGYSFTHEACRQHFQKIRRESKKGSSPDNASPNPSASFTTPSRKRKTPATPSTGGKRKSVSKVAAAASFPTLSSHTDSNDDDLETFETPSKKRQKSEQQEMKRENDYGLGYGDGDDGRVHAFKMEKDEKFVDLRDESYYDAEA